MWKKMVTLVMVVFAGILILGSGYVRAELVMEETPPEAVGENQSETVAEPQVETLEAAVQNVLETHPEIKAASYGRQARDWEVVQARGDYWPTLDASASWGYMKQDKPELEDDDSWPKQSKVSLRQNVYRGGANIADVNRQKARVKSQAYIVQGTSESLALRTTRVYLNVLRNMRLHELAKENLLNHERIADQVELRLESGVDAKAEMEQVLGRLALAKSNIAVTTANLHDAITDYQAVVGRLPGNLVELKPLDVNFSADLYDAEQLALKRHPIVRSAEADLEAREAQYNISKNRLAPSVDLSVDYNWDKDVWPIDDQRNYFSASATVSMNLFAGGRDRGRIKETLYLLKEAEEILQNARRETAQSLRLSWEANRSTRERVVYLEEYAQAAEATAEVFGTQWNIGRRTMFDLLDTQAEAINAKADLTRARYDLMYSEYRILNSMGMLVHSLGLEWPEEGVVEEDRDDSYASDRVEEVQSEEAVEPEEAAEPEEDVASGEEDLLEA